MGATIKIDNGPVIFKLQEIVVGSRARCAIKIEQNINGVWSPMDFSGLGLVCHVKDNVKNDVDPDATWNVVARGTGPDLGWLDCEMSASATTALGAIGAGVPGSPKMYEASIKVVPGDPDDAETVAVLLMPVVWRATR